MGIDDLAGHGLTHPQMAWRAAIRRGVSRVMTLPPRVAVETEVFPSHGAKAETMLVVVTGRAQAASQLARGRVTHELSSCSGGHAESLLAQGDAGGSVAVQDAPNAGNEVLTHQGLLELWLMTAPALGVRYGLREVGMVSRHVTLSTADAPGRMQALGVLRAHSTRVAGGATLHVPGGSRDRIRSVVVTEPTRQEAAAECERDQHHED
jgi:hypothetical protein